MQVMKTVTLDAHTERSQMAVISPEGEILIELQVETTPEELGRVVSGIPGPKRVVLEMGPLSAMIHDALDGVAEEVVSCDPTRNALVSRSDGSNDRLDARRLGVLDRAGATHEVYVPPEPYRTLRSLVHYDYMLSVAVTRTKNQLKALCRRYGVRYRSRGVVGGGGRVAGASARRSTQTEDGYAGSAGGVCSGNAASSLSVRSPTTSTAAACAGRICDGMTIYSRG